MTQAMAVKEMVEAAGHQVVAVTLGVSAHRQVPEFFESAMKTPVRRLPTLEFKYKDSKAVSNTATLLGVLGNLPKYRRIVRQLDDIVRETQPDILLNFFEPVAAFYTLTRRQRPPVVTIGHQFMFQHPGYVRTPQLWKQLISMRIYTWLLGARATKLALSFYPAPDLPGKRIIVGPPILRKQLFMLEANRTLLGAAEVGMPRCGVPAQSEAPGGTNTDSHASRPAFPSPDATLGDEERRSAPPLPNKADGNFTLVYLLNHGYADQIIAWSAKNPQTKLHCFYDKPGAPAEFQHSPSLTFHKLDGEKFLKLMAECRNVVCTAGFESVSEAAWLGKPLFLVPVENHIEQQVNAIDAQQFGLGIAEKSFNLDRLAELPDSLPTGEFRAWLDCAPQKLFQAIEQAITSQR